MPPALTHLIQMIKWSFESGVLRRETLHTHNHNHTLYVYTSWRSNMLLCCIFVLILYMCILYICTSSVYIFILLFLLFLPTFLYTFLYIFNLYLVFCITTAVRVEGKGRISLCGQTLTVHDNKRSDLTWSSSITTHSLESGVLEQGNI